MAVSDLADLALAHAARDGVTGAIEELERRHRATIDATCRRFVQPGYALDDLRQVLRAKLFVAEGKKPARIAFTLCALGKPCKPGSEPAPKTGLNLRGAEENVPFTFRFTTTDIGPR